MEAKPVVGVGPFGRTRAGSDGAEADAAGVAACGAGTSGWTVWRSACWWVAARAEVHKDIIPMLFLLVNDADVEEALAVLARQRWWLVL